MQRSRKAPFLFERRGYMIKENIQLVTVRTFGAGNMGSIIRAMKNFECTSITAVTPLFTDMNEVEKFCAGAKDHLKHYKQGDSLLAAVAQSNHVYAFSARKRKGFRCISPREMANEIARFSNTTQVSLLFGNETNGLNSEEIECADTLVIIPTSPSYSSLNLAQAALLALYELQVAFDQEGSLSAHGERTVAKELVASTKESKRHQIQKMIEIVYLVMPNASNTTQARETIEAIVRKVHLNTKEIGFVDTLLALVKKRLN